MTHACSMVGGAMTPSRPAARASSADTYTGFSSPIASTQCWTMGWLTATRGDLGGARREPDERRQRRGPVGVLGRAVRSLRRLGPGGHRFAQRDPRRMPRPTVATISRCTSLTPPPKVLICAWRADSSSRPFSAAPGEPATRYPRAPRTPSRTR